MYFLLEAIVVGVGLTFLGMIITTLMYLFGEKKMPSIRAYALMSLLFFLMGFFFHILAEMMGINKWYCSQGYACKR